MSLWRSFGPLQRGPSGDEVEGDASGGGMIESRYLSVVLIFKALNKPVACKRQRAAFPAGIDKIGGVNGASRAP